MTTKEHISRSPKQISLIMAIHILHNIAATSRNAVFYSVMIDETIDQSNREQAVFVLCWVSEAPTGNEECISLYLTSSTTADTLVSVLLSLG